ncbi:MAG: 3-phenylpropionate/cinnamic acid dioxygenase ferredoxin subunit [Chloroflexi bacterium ADurb.Bin325]|nr:MAG: 3-phenylpropionate/cinnamic acid dioxygenase ferredoxin subunit [Chloroflexi bacterium ADurb.Bin325]
MANFVKVARVEDIRPGEKKIFEVDGVLVVLVNLDGEFYAIENTCTHDGGPLGEGKIQNGQIICPRHGARFDIRTGAALTLPAVDPTATYEVRVQDGDIYIESY